MTFELAAARWVPVVLAALMMICLPSCRDVSRHTETASTSSARESLDVPGAAIGGRLVADPAVLEIDGRHLAVKPRAELTLRNTGTAPLQILGIQPRCGCIVSETPRNSLLAPGETEVLSLSFAVPARGSRETLLIVETDGKPRELRVPVILHGPKFTPPWISDIPDRLIVSVRSPDEWTPREFQIETVEPESSVWIQGLSSEADNVRSSPIELVEEEDLEDGSVRRWYWCRIETRLYGGTLGQSLTYVQLQVDPAIDVNKSPSPISVITVMDHPIRIVPERVVFRLQPEPTFPMEQQVLLLLSESGESDWSIQLPSATPSWLELEEMRVDPPLSRARKFQIRVNRAALDAFPESIDRLHETVWLESSSIDQQPLQIPVLVLR